MNRAAVRSIFALVVACSSAAVAETFQVAKRAIPTKPYALEQRVSDRRAVEEVLWRHRIWPKENPSPRPSLDAVLPRSSISQLVTDSLKMSAAVEALYQRPISNDQLQGELNRMSGATHDPALLAELYAALGNDPRRIAETLARPALAERWLRFGYAFDARIHATQRRRAEDGLAQACSGVPIHSSEAIRTNVTYLLDAGGATAEAGRLGGTVRLSNEEWNRIVGRFSASERRFAGQDSSRPVRACSLAELREDADSFSVVVAVSVAADEATVSTWTWPKRSFDRWWQEQRPAWSAELPRDVGSLALSSPIGGCREKDTWRAIATTPEQRSDHSAVWTGTEMIVWGGWTGSGPTNGGWRYSPATDSWTPTSTGVNVPVGRFEHQAVWTGTEMIIWGGSKTIYSRLNDGGRYDPRTDTWAPISVGTNVPSPRSNATATWTGGEMIVWGGIGNGGERLDDGSRYRPATDTWTPVSRVGAVPAARAYHTAIWTGKEMIVWGGQEDDGGWPSTSTGAKYSPSLDAWFSVESKNAPSGRQAHSAIWTGDEMIVWGGRGQSGVSGDGARYRPSSNVWLPVGDQGDVPEPRWGHNAIWTGREMIVWGGITGDWRLLGTGARYDPVFEMWVELPANAQTASPRYFATAVVTEKEMIVWGGQGTGGGLNSGGRFNFDTNQWTATAAADPPKVSSGESNLWTGVEMIIWGGRDYLGTLLNSGTRYIPALDRWSPLPDRTPALLSFQDHAAVWTGNEMIVWGWPSGSAGALGMRYDPTANRWSDDFVGTDPPAPRNGFAAVWTGADLLIWGGGDGIYQRLREGGRYDPSTGAWREIATGSGMNNFFHRDYQAAVWTGRDLIVWGGDEGGLFVHARYAAADDHWSDVLDDSSAPPPRRGPSGVWTGREVAVYGGRGTFGYPSQLGLYDPATDSWRLIDGIPGFDRGRDRSSMVAAGENVIVWGGKLAWNLSTRTGARLDFSSGEWVPTTTDQAPLERFSHHAVWTGVEMLVWGGWRNDSHFAPEGAGYCAGTGPLLGVPAIDDARIRPLARQSSNGRPRVQPRGHRD